jgi:ankyrin repeat protein
VRRKKEAAVKRILMIIMVLVSMLSQPLWAGPIHDACKAGDLGQVKALLAKDPSLLQAKTEEGKSPLHMATGWGQVEIVKYLIAVGADIHAVNNNGGNPIHVAGSQNQPECARILVAHGARINAKQGKTGSTPLLIAVFKGNHEVARVLVELGADVNIPMSNGATPLQVAMKKGDTKMIDLLKSKGAR